MALGGMVERAFTATQARASLRPFLWMMNHLPRTSRGSGRSAGPGVDSREADRAAGDHGLVGAGIPQGDPTDMEPSGTRPGSDSPRWSAAQRTSPRQETAMRQESRSLRDLSRPRPGTCSSPCGLSVRQRLMDLRAISRASSASQTTSRGFMRVSLMRLMPSSMLGLS